MNLEDFTRVISDTTKKLSSGEMTSDQANALASQARAFIGVVGRVMKFREKANEEINVKTMPYVIKD